MRKTAGPLGRKLGDSPSRQQSASYFILAVLGFSFWFFMAVPFASHRESYWWLAMVHSRDFAHAFSFISSTYRPLHQGATWLGFVILDPNFFPTSVVRQAVFQGLVYAMFVLAWWLIYTASAQRRLFALIALAAGGIFFSGYVQLFHIYGISYVPVMLVLGALLRAHAMGMSERQEVAFAAVSTVLVFWHPFATALFVGFYFGYYLDTFRQRSKQQHVQSLLILLVGATAVVALVVLVPRFWPAASKLLVQTATRSLDARVFAFLVSYRTNEVNPFASLAALVLTQVVVFSLALPNRLQLAASFFALAAGVVFFWAGLPLLLLWILAGLIKLLRLRSWSLFFLMLAAALLPFGGGIGTPIHALFAIIIAAYVTPLGWWQAEEALSLLHTRYVWAIVIVATGVILLIRSGFEVPVVTRIANPLLAERERTYQLETILAWLRDSDYCAYQLSFAEKADNPVDSVDSAISRRNRPPAALEDVQLFWNSVLQCKPRTVSGAERGTVVVTFGEPAMPGSTAAFKVAGRYGGDATAWIEESHKF